MDVDDLVVHEVREADLRSVFRGEASGFTPWLAREDNLARLGAALGLSLETLETEASTGTFRVDLVARNTTDDTRVIVENQFSRSDHDHLGKALTYLAASARTTATSVVWLAERFADEHRAVLEWLNDNTGEETGFWAVVPKVLHIGDSPPGLRFDVVVAPNRVVKATRTSAKSFDPSVMETRARYWPVFEAALAADPDLAGTVTKFGGGLGHTHVFPNAAFADRLPEVCCLAYINVPASGAHNTGVAVRPNPGQESATIGAERVEQAHAAWEALMTDERVEKGRVPVSFKTEESMRAAAQEHAARVKQCLRILEAEFGDEVEQRA